MDPAQTRARSQPAPSFEDGFGRRQQIVSASKDPVEVLVLKRELLATPGFEAAVRERVEQVARFHHESFIRTRGLARLAKHESGVALVSELVEGKRLSQLLQSEEHSLDMSGALMLVGHVMEALAAFHQAVPGCHGAVAPERMLLKADGRLVITDHVFGSALPLLSLDAESYWQQLQVALLPAATPTFNQQTDLAQVASVALALLLGRPLGPGYPNRIGAKTGAAALSISAALELVPQDVATWISRALQRTGHDPFASSADARDAFVAVLAGVDRVAARQTILAFYSGETIAAPAVSATKTVTPIAAATSSPTVSVPAPSQPAASEAMATPMFAAVQESSPVFDSPLEDDEQYDNPVTAASAFAGPVRRFLVPMTRRTIAVTAGVLMLLTTGGAFAAKRYLSPPSPVIAKGTLAVATNPVGASVVIDGEQRGKAPMTIELAAGDHVLQVGLAGSSRTIPFTVSPGAELSQVIDLPKVVAATGQLQIRTDPSGARVLVDGQKRGTSPLTVENLSPGVHMVTVEGQLGSVTQDVKIESGATAALVVPLTAPAGVPVSGWIAVSAPLDVQVFEKGQMIGSNRLEKIMASVGKHDLEIGNDALGYRITRSVTVTPGQITSIKLDPPKGTMALNAVPWAEVWIDGERIGETPVGNVQLTLGQHDVVFRHPELGEQRFTPTVTLNATARVSADMRRKP
jgi:hypothetical protein